MNGAERKWLSGALAAGVVAVFISACALVPKQARDKGADVIVEVCSRASGMERQLLRDGINEELRRRWAERRAKDQSLPADPPALCGVKCPGQAAPVVAECQPAG